MYHSIAYLLYLLVACVVAAVVLIASVIIGIWLPIQLWQAAIAAVVIGALVSFVLGRLAKK